MRLIGAWGLPAVALVMLAVTITPPEVWRAPTVDVTYIGFDPNLLSASAGGGTVQVTHESVDVMASADTAPAVNLATTLRRTLAVSVEMTLLKNEGAAQPFRFGVWSPWTGTGWFVAFGPAPGNEIYVETVRNGGPGATLVGGAVSSKPLARYNLNNSYRISIVIDRTIGVITVGVSGPGLSSGASLTRSESPEIFRNVQISLAASADAGSGTSHFVLRGYKVALPHERGWAVKVDDSLDKVIVLALCMLGLITILVASIVERQNSGPKRMASIARVPWFGIGGAALYLVGNVALFPLGGHPFDFANERLYAYVGKAYGPAQLYFLPDVTSVASTWNGIPWIQASFPYEPVVAYLFAAIGWLSTIPIIGSGALSAASAQMGDVIKSVNVAFGLADVVLIYLILRELGVGERWCRIGAGFFLFNPAVWFSVSVWGQTHVFSIFFVLLTILFAERRMPFWAWLALAAAVLTRPQMIVFGLLLGAVLVKKFTWRENLGALSSTVIVTFVALAPLTLATSPSLPVDILRNVFNVQEAGGNEASLTTVSQSAYSIWPLVTYIFHGASGMDRAYTPSASLLIGSVTYQTVSQILTVLAMLLLTGAILVRKRSAIDSGGYLPLVAVGVASFLLLLTGIVATHFLLALPLFLLCRRWMDPIAYCAVAVIWSVSTLVPMYGDMGTVISAYAYPLLAPANNPVTRFFVELYIWDRFITVAIVANICAVIWVAVLAYRPMSSPRLAEAGTAA